MSIRYLAAGLLMSVAIAATAQPKTLKIIVPYPPGGSPDNLARTISDKLQSSGAYNVVVENRPGGGGAVAVAALKNSLADGSTVLLTDSSTYSILPVVNKNPPFDPVKDLRPIGLAATSPIFLVAKPETAGTVQELIAKLKSGPKQAYGSSGIGTAHHLAMELFKTMSGTDMTHVPYKGSSQTVPSVVAGDVIATFAGQTQANTFAQNGRVKILAIAEPKRSALAPEVPTMDEAGLKGFNITITLGFLGLAAMPEPAVREINAALVKVLADKDVQSRLVRLGVEGRSSSPEEFGKLMAGELKSFGAIAKQAAIQVD